MSYEGYENYASQLRLEPLTGKVLEDAFAGTNFGRTDFRRMVEMGLLKVACGWHNGYTLMSIMINLGLVTKKQQKLTRKGQLVVWCAYGKEVTV